ncbi:hypothetical protein GCM10017776_08070 [Streptomyces griseoluteus]|nr:hypothetical protein GCM10017776_08070 [Streptomyces griseoluteus]
MEPARTAAAFRDFIMFLSSATRVAPGMSDAMPNESRPRRKPCVHKTYEIPRDQGAPPYDSGPAVRSRDTRVRTAGPRRVPDDLSR